MLKALHLLGACLFIGNIIISGLWKALADRTEQPDVMRFALRLVAMTDVLFTGSGIVLLVATGHVLASSSEGLAHQGSILVSYLLLGVSVAIWLAIMVPIQVRQSRMLAAMSCFALVPRRYRQLNRIWSAAGLIATLLPLPAIFSMISRG